MERDYQLLIGNGWIPLLELSLNHFSSEGLQLKPLGIGHSSVLPGGPSQGEARRHRQGWGRRSHMPGQRKQEYLLPVADCAGEGGS
jgi:hypothetical protein